MPMAKGVLMFATAHASAYGSVSTSGSLDGQGNPAGMGGRTGRLCRPGDGRLPGETPELLGFSAHWTWIWCVFWSSLFYGGGTDLGVAMGASPVSSALEPLWLVSLIANALGIAGMLVLACMRTPLAEVRGLPLAGGVLTCVGTIMIGGLAALAPPGAAKVVYLAGSALTGLGSGVVVVLWGEALASIGARQTIEYSVVAVLTGALGYVVMMLLPAAVSQALVALLPVLSMVLLMRFRSHLPWAERSDRRGRFKASPPWRMMLIAGFFGLLFGVMKGVMAPVSAELINLRDWLNILAIVLGAVALLVAMRVLRLDFDHLAYQVALPLMAAGFLFLPLHGTLSVVGTAVHQCGYEYFYILIWAIWPVVARQKKMPAGWVASWGMLAIQMGQLVGSVFAAQTSGVLTTDLDRAMLSATLIFVILLVAVTLFANQSNWGVVKPVESQSVREPLSEAVLKVARAARLSLRECDVIQLMARGRNRAYISEELSISDETVKSHVKSIYRKLGVHSQQELIDLVEESLRASDEMSAGPDGRGARTSS